MIPSDSENSCLYENRNIVLGIGCRKGTDMETIEKNVLNWLAGEGISTDRVLCAASIDLKKNEKGLCDFCRKYDIGFITFTAEQLMSVRGEFSSSDFVRNIIGTDNVCERSAVLASGGNIVMKKHAGNGVTCAAAEIITTQRISPASIGGGVYSLVQ